MSKEITQGNSGSHKKHAKASASKADQWVTCTASIAYIDRLIADGVLPLLEGSSPHAQEGTDAHDFAELYLRSYLEGKDLPSVPKIYRDRDEVGLIMSYINTILELKGEDILLVECEIPLFYSKDENAIVDACILSPNAIHIRDLKWGFSQVYSEYNRQSAIYAQSIIDDINDDVLAEKYPEFKTIPDDFPVTIGIIQPRTSLEDTVWELTYGELKKFNLETLVAYNRIMQGRVSFEASEKGCKWCRARYDCKFRAMMAYGVLPSNLEIGHLTYEDKLMIHESREQIEAHLKDVSSYLQNKAINEGIIPDGYMIAESNKNRRYPDDQSEMIAFLIREGLSIEMYKPEELKAQTHIKKLLTPKKAKEFDQFLIKPRGEPFLTKQKDYKTTYDFNCVDEALFDGVTTRSTTEPCSELFD